MKHFKLGIVLIVLAVMGNALQAAIPASERQALIDLYNATNGDSWTNKAGWKTPPLAGDGFASVGPESGTWYGISVPFPFDHVIGINLSENNLVGTLPASIGNLPLLASLNLHTNTLSGALPTELGNLTNLTVLHIYNNSFTGSLPSTLGNLTHLTRFTAHSCGLSGSIPGSLGTMASLQELYLHSNALTGALPTELGSLAALQILDAHANLLSGALPASLGNLTNLKSLLLSGNTLTGAIPTEWGGMTALEYLYLNNNQLSGSIPSSLGGLTHLIGAKLNDNALTGSIPSSFGGLTSLTALDLSRNQLDGEIPTQMGSMAALQNLALFSNKLEGPIPTSLTGLTNLSTSETAIGFNALYTSDSALIAFLNTKDFDWAATQTIAPTGVTATSLDNAVIMVSWLPIPYTGNTGGYRVYIADAPGGPYAFVGQTADKTFISMNVTSLVPGDRYYFVVRTQTNAHAVNPNDVISKNSTEVTAVAWTLVNVHVTGTVLSGTSPLAGVVMTGLPGGIVTNASGVYDGTVPADWSGTVTPTLAGHTFVPASRSYSNITTNQTGQNYASAFVSYPDRQALTDLYSATGGASWTNSTGWKTAPLYADGFAMPGTEGTWFGVTVNSGSHRVTHIDLNTNNLTGTFPASVSALTSLQGLNLSHNNLSGPIPASLGTLLALQTLYLNNNLLTGSIPAELGSLTGLQQLWLDNNQLNGAIPTTLGGLTSLLNMSLGSNLLTGSIPTQLGSLTSLQNLYLNSNQLSGSIPNALGTLVNLNQLLLDNNLLTGSVPAALGGLTHVQVLTLHRNQLSGSLPPALCTLTTLTRLTLNANMLAGSIPTTFANLINLTEGQTDIGYNGLYTSDATLLAFLAAKDPDWSETQTIAPASVTATALDGANILVSWLPIAYKANTGGYKVQISQTTGGPYTPLGQTADKWATVFPVSGLTPGETYYFVVQTHTDAHVANTNAIDSENSTQASATAWTQVAIQVTGTVMLDSTPLAGVVMSGLTGNPTTNASGVYTGTVAAGWSGTVTPTLAGYSFTPASRSYTGLTTDRTAQDYAAAYAISPVRQILIDLYNATDGDNWTVKTPGWKTAPVYTDGFSLPGTEGTWHGINMNGGTTIIGINLSEHHLVGTLPASIGNLTSLWSLNLHTNQLSGPIPESLGNLTNLGVLHLYENAFTGSLPSTLGNLTHLFQLKAHTNLLSGSIPAALGSMTALEWLDLSSNGFTGSLPTELGNLPVLQVLDAHNNSLSGELPESLGGLTNLTSLLLSANSFSGSIPTAWGGMGALEALFLNNNELSGSIPSSLGGLTHLIDLRLNDNELTGSIPSTFGGLTILTTLNLSNNHLEGVIPTQMGSLGYLQNLALFSNKLQGPVPTSLAALTNLSTSETAIGFNALDTTDGTLRTFLTSKDPDWAATQTIAPSGITATSLDSATIMVSWLPIEFTSYTGGYKVYMSQTSGGPYSQVGQTLDKTVASMNVTSLTPGQRYYFVVRTQTDAHVNNTNVVESANSAEASAVAWMQVVHVSGTVLSGTLPLAGVVMSGFTVPPVTNASGVYTGTQASGWSGTVTPMLAGYTFVPISRTYTGVTADQTGQNYTATGSAQTVTVTSPNGGESWAAGSTHNITWTQTGLTGAITVDLYKGGVWQKILGTPAATAGTFSWVIASDEIAGTDYRIRIWQTGVSDDSDADFAITAAPIRKDDLLGTWDDQGVYYRDSDAGAWVQVSSPASMITSGDLDNDGTDDLIGIWPGQGGVWVKYSTTGDWAYIGSTPSWLGAGDMNGDGRDDLLGTWDGQGVFYRNSETGAWVQMASPASMITSGDLDNDGTDDLIGIWPGQGGVWVKYSTTGDWAYIGSTPSWLGAGDMNGDGRDDLLGTWDGQGVFYRNSETGAWVQMASEATMITSGDLDGDGTDDLLGLWPTQGGIWVKYSSTGAWESLSSTAQYIATGKMRPVSGSSEPEAVMEVPFPMGGTEPGPESAVRKTDESSKGPGGWRFVYMQEKNLEPQEEPTAKLTKIPGPGEPLFAPQRQANLFPGETGKKRAADQHEEKVIQKRGQ